MDRTEPANLLSLPAEILGEIGATLAVEDYAHLRLTCRQIHNFTLPYFGRQFFRRRKFFRGPTSLDALLQISQSRLSDYLEHFILGTELLERDPPADSSHLDKTAYLSAYCDQTSLLGSGWDRDALATAFSNLKNLRAVEVEDFDDREKFDWDTGQLVNTMNGGYGLQTLLDNLGFDRPRLPHQRHSAHQWVLCVHTLLGALAKSTSSSVRPSKLRVTGREMGAEYMSSDALGVDDDAFRIPPFLRPSVVPVVEAFEELELDVHNRYIYPLVTSAESASFRTRNLREFLGMPKKLRNLRIRRFACGQLDGSDHQDDFWGWLAAKPGGQSAQATRQSSRPSHGSSTEGEPQVAVAASGATAEVDEEGTSTSMSTSSSEVAAPSTSNLAKMIPSPALSHLRELDLDNEDILSIQLFKLIKKVSPTLEKLTLSDIVIRDRGAEVSPEDEEQDVVRVETNLWADLCEKIATGIGICERLREVHLAGFDGLGNWHLQNWDGGDGESVFFKQLRISGEQYNSRAAFSYKGPKAKEALGVLAKDLRAAVRDGRHVFKSDLETIKRRSSF